MAEAVDRLCVVVLTRTHRGKRNTGRQFKRLEFAPVPYTVRSVLNTKSVDNLNKKEISNRRQGETGNWLELVGHILESMRNNNGLGR